MEISLKKRNFLSAAAAVLCTAVLASGCSRVDEQPVGTDVIQPSVTEDVNGAYVSPVYAALSDEEKALYDKVKAAVENFEEYTEFDEAVTRDEIRKIFKLVYAQERKYFWLSSIFYAPESELTQLKLSYLYEKDDAEIKRAELDLAASEILGEIDESVSDFEKVVYFHDRIVTGCNFSQTAEHSKSAYGVLVKGEGQCEGYASAMSILCDKAGISNYTVCGTNADGVTHAWNKILLDGKWYNSDCTWDDPILKHSNPDFVRHDCLLVTDAEIEGKTHFTDEELYRGLPVCDSTELNYFVGKDLVYSSAGDAADAVREQIKKAGLAGKREVELRLSDESSYYAALSRLFDSGEMKKMIEDVNGEYGTRIRSAYKHNNDNLYIVHISLIYEGEEE